eukprot:1579727-Prymnesium_polylepis.1
MLGGGGPLRPGLAVEVHGLQHRQELNGRRGILVRPNGNGRWSLRSLEGTPLPFLFRELGAAFAAVGERRGAGGGGDQHKRRDA